MAPDPKWRGPLTLQVSSDPNYARQSARSSAACNCAHVTAECGVRTVVRAYDTTDVVLGQSDFHNVQPASTRSDMMDLLYVSAPVLPARTSHCRRQEVRTVRYDCKCHR